MAQQCETAENPAVTNFREYLRIKSVHPDPDYDTVVKFMKDKGDELGLPWFLVEPVPNKVIVVITWEGTEPNLASVLLNSHTDVVEASEEYWKYDPFGAYKDENGDIYGRGAQDMKCNGIQYIEAVRRLKNNGTRLRRTVHMAFVPDEEIGGEIDVMEAFTATEEFKKLNVGVAFDEGMANPTNIMNVFYGEKSLLWTKFICPGDPGHGSLFIENNAGEKLRRVINSLLNFRDQEEQRLKNDPGLDLGEVTTLNLTIVEGGKENNVVPAEFAAYFDVRLAPSMTISAFKELIAKWCSDAGEGVKCEFILENDAGANSSVSQDDRWWKALSTALNSMKVETETLVFPAFTNNRFVRRSGIPAYGFSAMNNTPKTLHEHNEFLNEDIYLKGIDIFCEIITSMANVN